MQKLVKSLSGYVRNHPPKQFEVGANSIPSNQASMSDIDVYDVSAKVWHRVQASGDIPTSRRLFCGGLSSAADSSSHNM